MATKRRPANSRRRNPAAGLLSTFVSGITANLGSAVGAAVETIVISAGAVAIDRLILKRGEATSRILAGDTRNPTESPRALQQFLQANSQLALLLASAPVLQLGTLPDGKTHEVVFELAGSRLAARCLPDGQITMRNLPPQSVPPPTITVQKPLPDDVSPRPYDPGVIDCEQSPTGEWEPV